MDLSLTGNLPEGNMARLYAGKEEIMARGRRALERRRFRSHLLRSVLS